MEETLFAAGSLSRRSFLAGAGLMGAGAMAGGLLAGCSSGNAAGNASGSDTEDGVRDASATGNAEGIGTVVEPSSTEDADIVVVGSGIGGFMASMIAKEQAPDATVIMLEKNSVLGGSTNYAECNGPASNTPEDEARLKGMESASKTGYIANSMLHTERLREAGDNADWLFALHGVGYYNPGGPDFYEGGNGSSCIATLTPIAQEEGVDIRTKSRATALLTEDEYTVTGIQYTDPDGNVVHVNAKAVILATGGMSTNKELLGQYSSQDMSKIIGWGEGQDGDGHLMAEQTAHGRANHLCVASLFNNIGNGEESFAYDSPLCVCMAMQYSDCFVNEYGLRFCDESGGGQLGTSESGKLVESQGYVFSIADASMIEKYEAGGCTRHYSGFADKCAGQAIDLSADLQQYEGADYVFKADSIEELGEAIAEKVDFFDVDAFVDEMARYNEFAASGVDADYGKDAEYLWPIDTAPFYAFQICSGMLNTCGGIRINRDAQVTDDRGKVVKGLYAAGVCTSGWDGEVYGGGTCQTVGMWAGSRAARHAVVNVLGGTVADNWMGDVRSKQESAGAAGGAGNAGAGGAGAATAAGGDAAAAEDAGGEAPAA